MPSLSDLLQAKQTLSARFLRAGRRGGVVAMSAALRVADAVANAGNNVHAVGVGKKDVDGTATSQRCVRVYVIQKMALSLLPPVHVIPTEIDGIPTDVIESPPAFLLAKKKPARAAAANAAATVAAAAAACTDNRRNAQRPLVAGISSGHFNITAGTLGYFCRSTRAGDDPERVYVLSNNHVYADVNQGMEGDDLYQPGPIDGGTLADHIADLARFVTIALGGTIPNRVDGAIGALRPDITYRGEICSMGPIAGAVRGTEGMLVRKHGRTSGYTEGKITDENYDALVGMDHNDPTVVALFQNQMRIEAIDPYPAIGLGGDSGSLVVSKDAPMAVGLYFAGPESGVYGVANHLEYVLNELEIQLL